ncbi:TRAF3-interacting protein 1-like isoform X1 [Salvelinus fontinalis]|uniref:TRAF3-interacting protein 1-like isoform X1 n=1 Tax=Salvelinus fontinalis TaxID=8038 RepID=UPI002484DCF1|nr:TRAF3-interacting protein 1-like isoform X1 [Salvelinus fontinalis]
MNGSVAKKTQDTLGKVIKKPPLTEKLLSKPPFRYLHDIFSEVIRTTGFMKGLYAETEMKSDNVKDKDAKIAFLQKALDVVMLVNGEPLSVKPARIVAGHEPERTNELLQAIAKCCLNKLSSEEAVKRVLAGDKLDPKGKASSSRSQDKENREGRDQVEKAIREHSAGGREQKDPDLPKEQEGRRGDKEKERHRDRERSKKSRDPDRTKDRGKDKSRDREWDKDNEREKDGERDKERDRDREKSKDKESHRGRDRERDKEKDLNPDKRRDKGEKERELRHKQGEEKTKVPEKGDKKARASEDTKHRPHPEEPSKTAKPEPAPIEDASEETAEVTYKQSDSPARIPRPSSAKGQRRWPKAGGQQEEFDGEDGDTPLAQRPVPLENGDATDAVPAHRRIPRPSSARPAPPRFKRQESYTDVTPAERLTSAKPPAAVITEGKKLSEDEDEQFVVLEAAPPPPDMPEMEPTVELQGDENHGGLVKKILETTKDFESSPSSPKSKDQTQSLVSEASRKKERDLVSREIERLRSSIQTVCRSALPLGKIMDYIQEDMDAMQNELHTWRRENKEHAQALLHEQRVTDSAVEPLKAELAELEQLIKEQQDKICAVKSNILKNEDKIHKMVTSINFSSRI